MGQYIENTLLLEPIRIQVNFGNLCGAACSVKRTAASKSSLCIGQEESGINFLYPQALIKQKYPNQSQNLSYFDMFIWIESGYEYYFPMDYPGKQTSCQYDFMLILTNRVLHGLGIASSLKWLNSELTIPYPDTNKQLTNFYFTIFDKYIYMASKNRSLEFYANLLSNLGPIKKRSGKDISTQVYSYSHIRIFKALNDITNHSPTLKPLPMLKLTH
ncbi:hypothetical protein DSO57_1038942 [Entomophthora muscae]|uniref:Uncharacterized protein n=1 Tax=Entomophthora muscae TaxID=34485 RepID=A0ACC2T9J4_9FUNG|nr:hypothetical protein DSO57_1038942 [Entomophthora muscae]